MKRSYTVACLAGDGLGPELMAEASRTLRKVARMHGFAVDDVHAPFGSEALTRSGHPLPAETRAAVQEADAVLVADMGQPALAGVTAELDLRARVTQVLSGRADFVLLSPLDGGSERWTVERAFALSRSRRGRLVSVDGGPRWSELVAEEAARNDSVEVEHASLAETLRRLAFEPRQLDVLVAAGMLAPALEELAGAGDDRLAAVSLLAGSGGSVFAPARPESHDDAGHGVADPSSMLVAVSLLLREGLGEAHAADTLVAALRDARGRDPLRRTLTETTRDFGDAVTRLLPSSHRNAEFLPESAA
ncbi:MAG TPA: isocitrate/isopropylmalate family dehydrogenase [Gaiellaceae bacterium]|nr:isocitrate/isopropylmalate family dehydrogenase [Gaiellaceae bacterium]